MWRMGRPSFLEDHEYIKQKQNSLCLSGSTRLSYYDIDLWIFAKHFL